MVHSLTAALQTAENNSVVLALLEGLFLGERKIEFDGFQIVRPIADELNTLLGIDTNRIFYPWAVCSPDRLTDHWYIWSEGREHRRKIGHIQVPWDWIPPRHIQTRYTTFPAQIEEALKRIILWDWQADSVRSPADEFGRGDFWYPFSIPFVLVASNDPFRSPPSAPAVESLQYKPVMNDHGEEIGEEASPIIRLDRGQTGALQTFVMTVIAAINAIRPMNELFDSMDRGLSHLVKAFLSEDLEQLLWHITAIESLLGGHSSGPMTEAMAKRVAAVYSEDPKQKDNARSLFHELYDHRSELVHGRPLKATLHTSDLRRARGLARELSVRTLMLLEHLATEATHGRLGWSPRRKDFLRALDVEPESRTQMGDLLRALSKHERDTGEGRRCLSSRGSDG
jgi:hypothetical protein